MKTYTQNVEEPRLVIEHDNAPSPREDDNLGFFFTAERRYSSPDGTKHWLYDIMTTTAEEARGTTDHKRLIRERASAQGFPIVAIYPVLRFEHGNVAYRRGTGAGFDTSNCGFYIVTDKKNVEHLALSTEEIEKMIDQELKRYTQWANGEVYRFTLYDEDGVEEDTCGGFYDIEDIREHLPEEWAKEKLEDYIVS